MRPLSGKRATPPRRRCFRRGPPDARLVLRPLDRGGRETKPGGAAPMHLSAFDRSKAKRSTSENFSGEVYMQEIVPESASKEVTVTAVFFENGARTLPHVHVVDQILS